MKGADDAPEDPGSGSGEGLGSGSGSGTGDLAAQAANLAAQAADLAASQIPPANPARVAAEEAARLQRVQQRSWQPARPRRTLRWRRTCRSGSD